MKCHFCPSDMHPLGCCTQTGKPVEWCPSCGSVKPCDQPPIAPVVAVQAKRAGFYFTTLEAPNDRDRVEGR